MTKGQIYLVVWWSIAVLAVLTISLFQLLGTRQDLREIRRDIQTLTGKVIELMEKVK